MKLLAGNANQPLASSIADYLDVPLTRAQVRRFADNEIFATIDENVRGEDVFIIQSTSAPANDHLMELLICMDALRRASARRITAVLPYFGYARQDRKSGPRTPISAKLVANHITVAGADRPADAVMDRAGRNATHVSGKAIANGSVTSEGLRASEQRLATKPATLEPLAEVGLELG